MAAGKEIHQKCVTGHKETWGKQQKRTKHDLSKCNSLVVGNNRNKIKHNALSVSGV